MRLRIISGELGGRFIKAPDSKFTRPTTQKVKESIFNQLSNFFGFQNKLVLDLYSGSGSLGFEALSRGAAEVHFIEKNFKVYQNLSENAASLNVAGRVKIFKTDTVKYLSSCSFKYDLILADPPFFMYDIHTCFNLIRDKQILAHDGILIIERSVQTIEKDSVAFALEPYRKLGDTALYIMERN